MASEMERTRQRSQKAKQRGEWQKVVELLESYRKALPDDKAAALDLGDALMKLERFDDACRLYADLLEAYPKDTLVASNFGGALLRCGKIEEAKALLEYSLELNPKNIYARINLGGVYQTLRDYNGALKNSLEAVSIDPTHPLAFNNLGSSFSDLAKFEEAKHAYETAVLLDPKSVDALINLATTEVKLGGGVAIVEMFERILSMLPAEAKQRAEAVRFFASFEHLRLGDLKKGWNYYKGGFSPLVPQSGRRSPNRVFDVPEWDGEALFRGNLLVWREQGLGDEVLFGTCLPDLESLIRGRVILECDPRMVEVWAQTFPDFVVRPQAFDTVGRPKHSDFNRHIPIGSLPQHFRGCSDQFFGSPKKFLRSTPEKELKAGAWVSGLGVYKPLVGICWRSGMLDPNRNLQYSSLLDWEGLLKDHSVEIVNLQYGDCESELQAAEQKFGRRILRPEFDLKNDLGDFVALTRAISLVVSAHTAVLHLSAYSGVRAFSVDTLPRRDWVYLGQDQLPWYKNSRSISLADLRETSAKAMLDLLWQ